MQCAAGLDRRLANVFGNQLDIEALGVGLNHQPSGQLAVQGLGG